MFKLLVLSCLLVSCLADPSDLPSRLREAGHQHRHPRGCANRAEGWRACARLNSSDSLAPHGRDCSLFFDCSGGARPACRHCPAGLHFDPQRQVCDSPENVNCVQHHPHPPRPPHNRTTPYPTTTDDDHSTITVIDVSTSTEGTPSTIIDVSTSTEGTPSTIDISTEGILSTIEGTSDTTEPSVFTWGNYIPWVRK